MCNCLELDQSGYELLGRRAYGALVPNDLGDNSKISIGHGANAACAGDATSCENVGPCLHRESVTLLRIYDTSPSVQLASVMFDKKISDIVFKAT